MIKQIIIIYQLFKKNTIICKLIRFFLLWNILINIHSLVCIYIFKFLIKLLLIILIFNLTFIYIFFGFLYKNTINIVYYIKFYLIKSNNTINNIIFNIKKIKTY